MQHKFENRLEEVLAPNRLLAPSPNSASHKKQAVKQSISSKDHENLLMDSYNQAVDYLRSQLPANFAPHMAIVCGSGLGGLSSSLESTVAVIDYTSIPHFCANTVEGHEGKLAFGYLQGIPTICMIGRFHLYEGYNMTQITFPHRVFILLGIKVLIVTNASGALNNSYKVGDVMIIRDHLSMVGLAGLNPLFGPNLKEFGPRFPSMTNAYDSRLGKLFKEAALNVGFKEESVKSGIYVCVAGPSFETKAECRYLRSVGADAVGMSTVPEVVVARHAGIDVLGVSLITNVIDMRDCDEASVGPNHAEVLEAAKNSAKALEQLFIEFAKLYKIKM